jgi:hypothetical protein
MMASVRERSEFWANTANVAVNVQGAARTILLSRTQLPLANATANYKITL